MGNRIFRNVNSSSRLTRIICILSGSDSSPEWYSNCPDDISSAESISEVPGDDLSSDSISEVFDMASFSGFRNVGSCQLLVCTPKKFCSGLIPDKGCCKLNGRNYTSAGALPQV